MFGWLLNIGGLLVVCGALAALGERWLPSQLLVSQNEPPAPVTDSNAPRSLERALGGLSGDTLRTYLDRYNGVEPSRNDAATTAVFVDVEALARRHPAWQLALELEEELRVPLARRIRVSGADGLDARISTADGGADVDAASNALGAARGSGSNAVLRVRELPPTTVRAPLAFEGVAARERAELNDFVNDLTARQQARRAQEAILARRTLEDEVNLATRRAVDEVALARVDDDLALELTNLRLRLLENLVVPPAQRAQARAEIERIEARLSAIWAEQTRRQEAALRAALEEVPARLRREGELRLAADLETLRAESQALQAQLRAEFAQLLARDFEGQNALSWDSLRLFLPPAREPVVRLNGPPIRPVRRNVEQNAGSPASASALQIEATSDRTRPGTATAPDAALRAEAERLRAEARRDAARWARSAATRLGGSWNPRGVNRTPEAIELLFDF